MSEQKLSILIHSVLMTIGTLVIVLNRKNKLQVDTYPF